MLVRADSGSRTAARLISSLAAWCTFDVGRKRETIFWRPVQNQSRCTVHTRSKIGCCELSSTSKCSDSLISTCAKSRRRRRWRCFLYAAVIRLYVDRTRPATMRLIRCRNIFIGGRWALLCYRCAGLHISIREPIKQRITNYDVITAAVDSYGLTEQSSRE